MKFDILHAVLFWTCFLQVSGNPGMKYFQITEDFTLTSVKVHVVKHLNKLHNKRGLIPDIPIPIPKIIPKPIVPNIVKPIPKVIVPEPPLAPKPIEAPAPKAPDAPVPQAPKALPNAPVPKAPNAPIPKEGVAPVPLTPSKPLDIEPDEATLCKRSGCDIDDARLAKIQANAVTQQNKLDDAITHNLADTGSKDNIELKYDRISQKGEVTPILPISGRNAWFSAKEFGMDNDLSWTRSVIKNKQENLNTIGESNRPPILITFENPEKGAILVSKSSNKEEDIFVTDPDDMSDLPTRWSDMTMDNWRTTAGPANVKNLKWIFRDNIVNSDEDLPSTEALIDKALQLKGEGEVGPIEFPAQSTGIIKDAYNALAGSIHVDRVVKMLADHHIELGDLTIESIWVLKGDGEYNLAIQLKAGL